MPLIIGYNISPFQGNEDKLKHLCRGDRERYELASHWREKLGIILEKVTCEYLDLKPDEATCFFPHDPSVPTDPYPIATLVVDLLFVKPDRVFGVRQKLAKLLAEKTRDFLNEMRGTTDAKVEVAVKPFDPEKNGFYMTP